MMYYLLQSSVTTNIYELPGLLDSNTIFSSSGAAGLEVGAGFGA